MRDIYRALLGMMLGIVLYYLIEEGYLTMDIALRALSCVVAIGGIVFCIKTFIRLMR